MNKPARLSIIAALIAGGAAAPMVATKREVKEEIQLASKSNDEQSTLDEADNLEILSPNMLAVDVSIDDRKGGNGYMLTEQEQREVGRKLFITKQLAQVEVEEPLPADLDIDELTKWADEVAPV